MEVNEGGVSEAEVIAVVCAVCGVGGAGVRRCAGCSQVGYCGRAHQKQHWPQHRPCCFPVEERQQASLGRYLVSSRALRPGALLLSEAPLVSGPKLRDASPLCIGCLRAPPPTAALCRGCGLPLCARAHGCPGLSHGHPPIECQVLRGAWSASEPVQYELLTPLRCLLLQRSAPARWAALQRMEAHEADRAPGTPVHSQLQAEVVEPLRARFALRLQQMHDGDFDCSEATLHRVCGVLDVNAMEVRVGGGAECVALFERASLMEHSCVANTRHAFVRDAQDRLRVEVRAALPIDRGAHVSTMYTHALWATHARLEHLQETKHFACACQRCADPSELGSLLAALRCPAPHCRGPQLPTEPLRGIGSPWRCTSCGSQRAGAQVKETVARCGADLDDALMQAPEEGREGLRGRLETLLEHLLEDLYPQHFLVVTLQHSLLQLLPAPKLSDQRLRWKAERCREVLSALRAVDPGAARLPLYSAVLQLELARAAREMRRRTKHKQEDKEEEEEEEREALAAAEAALAAEAVAEGAEEEGQGGGAAARLLAVVRAERALKLQALLNEVEQQCSLNSAHRVEATYRATDDIRFFFIIDFRIGERTKSQGVNQC